ncbi:hypothetical protein VPH35_115613 [Triticum aestivum]
MQGLLLLALPLVPLVVLAVIRHAGPIKTRLATVMSALAPKLPAAWRKPVFVSDCATAYRLLVRGSASGSFSNRLPSMAPSAVLSAGRHHNITSAPHGPFWRAIRHNLTSQLFHLTRLHRYALARRNALRGLVADLREQQQQQHGVVLAAESFRDAIFNVVCTMCFGDGVYPALVRAIADAQDELSLPVVRVFVCSVFPVTVTRLIYRKQWNELVSVRQKQEDMYLPLIDACRRCSDEPPCYVDTLLDLEVPVKDDDQVASVGVGGSGQNKRISDAELVGLCSEFLGAGSETVAAAIQWIMANLVKRPDIKEAVCREIDDSMGAEADEVGEEVLEKLEYLNAVVMEALRLHPTTALVFRQVMKEDDVVLDGRRIGVGTTVIFPLETLACDKTVWADPDVFKPERFLASGGGETMNLVAAAGSARKMKMMPFGAGRRICPGMGVAMIHIGYFVANLVREFVWKEAEGEHTIDLQPHTIVLVTVMKRPLRAHLLQRRWDAKNIS